MDRISVQNETEESRLHGGEALAAISNGVVRLMRGAVGKGPTKCKTHWAGSDTLVVVLGGGYLEAEKTLYAAGKAEDVRSSRQAIQEVLEDRFRALVEDVVGRPVIAFMSAQHQNPDLQVEIFVLDEGANDRAPLHIASDDDTGSRPDVA